MVGQRDPKFYNELQQLNQDIFSYVKEAQEKSPYFDFTPTFNDYAAQIADLLKQYPEKSATSVPVVPETVINSNPLAPSTTTTTSTITSSTASQLPSFSTTFSNPFSSTFTTNFTTPLPSSIPVPISNSAVTSLFSSIKATPATTSTTTTTTTAASTTQPFLFGAPSSTSTTSSTASPFFSFVPPTFSKTEQTSIQDTTQNNDGAADDEVHQPPEPKIDKYEEPDSSFSVKCKLYERVKNSDLNLLGIGTFYIKALDNQSKLQVIMRQDPDLRRVLLNEVITSNIPVKLLPKAVQIAFPSPSGESKFYIAKVKDEAEASALHDHLKSLKP